MNPRPLLALVLLGAVAVPGRSVDSVALLRDAETTAGTFITAASFDVTSPSGAAVQTTNGGAIVGSPEAGDAVLFTFTEAMDPASILVDWDGLEVSVVVRITDGGASNDRLTVHDANATSVALGTVDLAGTTYVTASRSFGATGTPSKMTMSDMTVSVVLGTPSGGVGTAVIGQNMTWTPASAARDLGGNACLTTAVVEADPVLPDVEF